MYEADLCHGCGQPRTYAHDADAAGHWKAPPPTRCHSCTAIESEQRKHDEKHTRALMFHAEPDDAMRYAMEHPLPAEHAPQPPRDAREPEDGGK